MVAEPYRRLRSKRFAHLRGIKSAVSRYAIALRQCTRGIIIEEDHAAAAQAITFELPSDGESAVVGTNIFATGLQREGAAVARSRFTCQTAASLLRAAKRRRVCLPPRNDERDKHQHSRGTKCPSDASISSLPKKRAQGMPVQRTHPQPCVHSRKARKQVTTGTPKHPAFPA
jgi:hypothetical protein